MAQPKKPTKAQILLATPLSTFSSLDVDRMAACNVCGKATDSLTVWREHDEHDLPRSGDAMLVFIGNDHPKCIKVMEKHPRLYTQEAGLPGNFPKLCAPCTYRRGVTCSHPNLRVNGGNGLAVKYSDPFRNAILCGRGGRIIPIKHFVTCEGQTFKDGE